GFVMRGIFLGSRREVDWFLYSMGIFFPEAAREFQAAVPTDERADLLDAFHRRLVDPDPAVHLPAARAWSPYESACPTLRPGPGISASTADRAALSLARIEAHYFRNRLFLADDQLLDGLHRIRHLPAVIVQGRYDVVCPIVTADALVRHWPEADYVVVP